MEEKLTIDMINKMDMLEIYTRVYGSLHNHNMPVWIMKPARILIRTLANWYLPKYLYKPIPKREEIEKNLIVSLTSFPARINDVWKVVESLKRQTVLPEKIVLWLSKEQFLSHDSIPIELKKREDAIFEIRMVDEDIRSHKKYYYTLQNYPDKTLITCDDDIYYYPDMIKDLVKTSKQFPNCIIANITSEMIFENETLQPYKLWNRKYESFASRNRVQIGVGGVLYPPHCLSNYVLRKDLFTKLAPLGDDLWLNLMARLKRTPVVQNGRNILPLHIQNASPSLCSINNGTENMNDVQIRQLSEWLKNECLPNVYDMSYLVEYLK